MNGIKGVFLNGLKVWVCVESGWISKCYKRYLKINLSSYLCSKLSLLLLFYSTDIFEAISPRWLCRPFLCEDELKMKGNDVKYFFTNFLELFWSLISFPKPFTTYFPSYFGVLEPFSSLFLGFIIHLWWTSIYCVGMIFLRLYFNIIIISRIGANIDELIREIWGRTWFLWGFCS